MADDDNRTRDENGSNSFNLAVPVLPGASQAAHVTLSGGVLGGPDVVRVADTHLTAPDRIEVGALVELQDGTRGKVVKVRGKRLSEFCILEGGVEIMLGDGTLVSKPSRDVARVVAPPA